MKLDPLIVTVVPGAPEVGENEVTVGVAPVTVKTAVLVAVPLGVVTAIVPVVAPDGTDVWICVDEMTLKTAAVPLNETPVVPPKLDPVSVTVVPGVPEAGAKDARLGGGGGGGGELTLKLVWLTAVPAGVVTETLPLVAFGGTVAVICADEMTA